MLKDIMFQVDSPAQLRERVEYKDPNSKIHYKKQKGKDPNDERSQLFRMLLGHSWVLNCRSHEDFIRLCVLAITTGHRGIPRNRLGRSLVWSLPDGFQAVLWNLPSKARGRLLLFLAKMFEAELKRRFRGVACVIAIHCDKARIHLEALLLKYYFVETPRGKVKAKKHKVFYGYEADSAFRTAHVATSVLFRLKDPGYRRPNSMMCRALTRGAKIELSKVCRGLPKASASRAAAGALESFAVLKEVRSDSNSDKQAWNKHVFGKRSISGHERKPKKVAAFTLFLKRSNGVLPQWLGPIFERIRRIRERRRKVLLKLALIAKENPNLVEQDGPEEPSMVPPVDDLDRKPEQWGIAPDL